MEIVNNILLLSQKMRSEGWYVISQDDNQLVMKNEWIFTESIELAFPLDKTKNNFPILLETLLRNLIEIDSSYKDFKLLNILLAQVKNVKNKFSKTKDNWILSEPNSRYKQAEIPFFYVPKLSIFEK
ncbi:MAG: hypothetical protein V4520_06520 [Bacteroidota bacterium]